jgi:molecular chaperone DnaJ
MENLYELLGVQKNATPEQIKEAFREIARKNHPDTVQDEAEKKEFEEKFKRISNAYNVLSNQEKRREYDLSMDGRGGRGGRRPPPGRNPWGGGPWGGAYTFHFGTRGQKLQPDVSEVSARVDIVDFHRRKEFKIKVSTRQPCPKCSSTGTVYTKVSCPMCSKSLSCMVCGGTGLVDRPSVCDRCYGRGVVGVESHVVVQKGMRGGSKYVFMVEGAGDYDMELNRRGDLYVSVEPKGNSIFTPAPPFGVVCRVWIPIHVAACGGRVRVPTLNGMAEMTVPAGTLDGTLFKMPGMGLDVDGCGKNFGEQIVEAKIDIPKLSGEVAEMLGSLAIQYSRVEAFEKEARSVCGSAKE